MINLSEYTVMDMFLKEKRWLTEKNKHVKFLNIVLDLFHHAAVLAVLNDVLHTSNNYTHIVIEWNKIDIYLPEIVS